MKLITVHPTELQEYMCPRRHYFSRRMGLRPVAEPLPLALGTVGHEAMRAYYAGEVSSPEMRFWQVCQETDDLYVSSYAHKEATNFVLKREMSPAAADLYTVLQKYVDWSTELDDFEVLHLERTFKVPIRTRPRGQRMAWMEGKFDMVVKSPVGVWVVDHKFYSRFPNEEALQTDLQFSCYLWATRQLFENVVGILINVVRKQAPKSKTTELFHRYPVNRNSSQMAELYLNLPKYIRLLKDQDKSFLPYPGLHCSWCRYRDLCIAASDGSGWRDLAELRYVKKEVSEEDEPA